MFLKLACFAVCPSYYVLDTSSMTQIIGNYRDVVHMLGKGNPFFWITYSWQHELVDLNPEAFVL